MATWRLMGNLNLIRSDVRAHFSPDPVIGTKGDTAHASTVSDHNPRNYGYGTVVAAIDVMFGVGAKASAVVKACIGRSDLSYVIHNRTIWSAAYGWRARRYTGSNPHTDHVHISAKHTSTADKNRTHLKWSTAAAPAPKPSTTTAPPFPGEMKQGSHGTGTRALQARLNARGYTPKLKVDGSFGPSTRKNVLAFQKFAKIKQDGIVGKTTWGKLWSLKIT